MALIINGQRADAIGYIGEDNANNVIATSNVAANRDGSVLERLEQADELLAWLPHENNANLLTVLADLDAETWNTQAAHEIAVVTGLVRVQIIPVCTKSLTGDTATLVLGTEETANLFIASTTATNIDANELWLSDTPAGGYGSLSEGVGGLVYNDDIGYTVGTTAVTAGDITFYIFWTPISSGATVTAGAGGAFA